MSDEIRIVNAKIDSTMLGNEHYGIMTFYLYLDFGGSYQGFGGYSLDEYDEKLRRRKGVAAGMDLIIEIMRIVGVEKWEELPGQLIRVKKSGHSAVTKLHAIGNIVKDEWLNLEQFFKESV